MTLAITRVTSSTGVYWKARDVGVLLGFGSRGGNFSRMFTQGMFPKMMAPAKGKHWVLKRANPAKNKGQPCVWLTTPGLKYILELLDYEGTPYAKRARAMLRELTKRGFIRYVRNTNPPNIVFSEVLGAGLEVHYTPNGVVCFVFLDDEDRPHRLMASDLDENWEEKLLKAIGTWPK